jgi:flagellin-like hook-associated protein FlgL
MSVNTNFAAMNAYRNLSTTQNSMSKSLERLSSGYRINSASDDAAGLAISEGLRSQIGGLTQAVRNTQDGTSVVQTAEGALSETTSILQRMRDLSVQASSGGSLNNDAKASIQKEVSQLKSELTRISNTTQFNGTNLLDGSYKGTFQVGANTGETIGVTIGTAMGSQGLGVDGIDVTTNGNVAVNTTEATAGSAGTLDITLDSDGFAGLKGTVSANGHSLDLGSVKFDTKADTNADGSVDDSDLLQQLNQAAIDAGITSGTDATAGPFTGDATALTFTGDTPDAAATVADVAKASPTFAQPSGASEAIKKIDAAIKTVSSVRADLGAIQNRFEHTVNNLNTAIENTTASESRIRDTDMASEMTSFTRAQVLTQAGTSMLAQANQSTQSILKLLG